VHKEGTPIRPVVNFKSAPSYKLSRWFINVLKEYIQLSDAFTVPNSVHLMKDLADIPCVPEVRLASLDISNMYSNISTKVLLDIMEVTCKAIDYNPH